MLFGFAFRPSALALVVILISVATDSEGKQFQRCQLAQTLLHKYKFDKNSLGNWVCLAEAESSLNTAAIGPPNTDGSRDYGLFQINSRYWCSGGPSFQVNGCNVACSALTNDDISDDVRCARRIYDSSGFKAWAGWVRNCEGRDVQSYVANCKL